VATTKTLSVEPLSPAVGARITGIDLHRPVDETDARALRDAFARFAVLCLPGQSITAQDQAAFAALFGRVDADTSRRADDPGQSRSRRGVMLVSNIRKDGKPIGVLPEGEMHFHSDGAHRARPYRATTLYAIKVPSRGGDTLFATMAAAYEALSPDLQRRLDGLEARHVFNYNRTTREEMRADATDVAVHPLVRVHPDTGRRSLYLSRLMTRDIVGMDRAESDALLEQLFDHCERPEFVYAHRWIPGDLVIWDNRCVNHARTDFPADEARLLRRYTVSEPD
jgi:taurine dioxygenase